MKIVTNEQMEQIDYQAQENYGIPGLILMENAGIQVMHALLELYPDLVEMPPQTCGILVGAGNNGGDGLVVARQLWMNGIIASIYLVHPEEKYKGQSRINLDIIRNLGLPIYPCWDSNAWEMHAFQICAHPLLLDAILGTGLRGSPRGFLRELILQLNEGYSQMMIALDVPSGLISQMDEHSDCILHADHTITIGLPKMNMLDYPEKSAVGELQLVHIGFPPELLMDDSITGNVVTQQYARTIYPLRISNSHKGSYGKALILAGSKDMAGAAILSTYAATHSGCGLVRLASTDAVIQANRIQTPSAINVTLPEDTQGAIDPTGFDRLAPYLDEATCILFGPGCTQSEGIHFLLKQLLQLHNKKLIIDADGLNVLATSMHLLASRPDTLDVILTPHVGEFSRLVGKEPNEWFPKKMSILLEFCKTFRVTTILKDAVSITGTPSGTFHINTSGNKGLAKGGSGDILAGILTGIWTKGRLTAEQAANLSMFLHGMAADLAQETYHEDYYTPEQLVSFFPEVFDALT
jgi:ADP-dependent NAD(P)H-hydrate dehydratase / NAD(P)H-hydrate epimerase